MNIPLSVGMIVLPELVPGGVLDSCEWLKKQRVVGAFQYGISSAGFSALQILLCFSLSES